MAGRIRQHLGNYRQLLECERERLRALASRVSGTRRAVIAARVDAIEAARKSLEETFALHLPPARPHRTSQ
jgi:hypothetical protein